MEHWETLCAGGYRFAWDDALFRPGTDSFVLSSMPRLKRGGKVCDLGSGTGLLGLLLLQREPTLTVTGLEQSTDAVTLADRCASANGLAGRLLSRCMDLRDARACFPSGAFDLVVSNPPYFPDGHGRPSPDAVRRAARHESACTLSELAVTAAYLLRWGGAFCLVQKPERLADVFCALREAHCEAKRLRMVCATAAAPPSLVLVEGRRGGKPGLSWERPLVLRDADGVPTPELDAIYFRTLPAP